MTRSKSLMFGGAALAAIFAATAFAQMPPGEPRGPGRPMMPTTRAELQAKIAEHFKAADTNGDGFVTKAEFDAAREAMKAKFEAKRGEHRAEMFAKLDANHDGSLSKEEFMAPPPRGPEGPGGPDGHDMPPPPPGAGPDGGPGGPGPDGPMHGRHMMGEHGRMGGFGMGDGWFDRADANHDGKISLAEASAGPLAMFDRADTNHDGKISPEEHKAAFEAMRAKWKDKNPS